MRPLFAILGRLRPSLRGGFARRLVEVIGWNGLSGATAGLLPAVMGIALNAALGRPTPPGAGIAGLSARPPAGLSSWSVILAALGATLAAVAVSVWSSRRGSEFAGEVTAALRIE